MLEKNYHLEIKSEVKEQGAVVKRVYTLSIDNDLGDGRYVGSFISEDFNSRYRVGGSRQVLFQNQVIKMDLTGVNNSIAKLALKFDANITNGRDSSRVAINDALKKISKEKPSVIEV